MQQTTNWLNHDPGMTSFCVHFLFEHLLVFHRAWTMKKHNTLGEQKFIYTEKKIEQHFPGHIHWISKGYYLTKCYKSGSDKLKTARFRLKSSHFREKLIFNAFTALLRPVLNKDTTKEYFLLIKQQLVFQFKVKIVFISYLWHPEICKWMHNKRESASVCVSRLIDKRTTFNI